jgi:hypothetical protein
VLDDAPRKEDREPEEVVHDAHALVKVDRGVVVARHVPAAGKRHDRLQVGQVLLLLVGGRVVVVRSAAAQSVHLHARVVEPPAGRKGRKGRKEGRKEGRKDTKSRLTH